VTPTQRTILVALAAGATLEQGPTDIRAKLRRDGRPPRSVVPATLRGLGERGWTRLSVDPTENHRRWTITPEGLALLTPPKASR
jgi:hypothetical protein